jgi:hypothetical protein
MLDSFPGDSMLNLHLDRIVGVEAGQIYLRQSNDSDGVDRYVESVLTPRLTNRGKTTVTRMGVATISCIRWTTTSEYVPLGLEQVHPILR